MCIRDSDHAQRESFPIVVHDNYHGNFHVQNEHLRDHVIHASIYVAFRPGQLVWWENGTDRVVSYVIVTKGGLKEKDGEGRSAFSG